MKKYKYTIDEVIEYLGKNEIENLCNNIYNRFLPKISKVASPKLIIKWDFNELDPKICGAYVFPCYIIIYPRANIESVLKHITSLDDDAAFQVACETLHTIFHELSHTTQDYSLIDTIDGYYTKNNSYSDIVERDNEWRTYQNFLKYADDVENTVGLTINENFDLGAMNFSMLRDINYKSFIVNVCESYICGKNETIQEYNDSKEFVHDIAEYLSDPQCYELRLTINNNSTVLMSTCKNGIDKIYIDSHELTNWLIEYDIGVRYDMDMQVTNLEVGTNKTESETLYIIDIVIDMKHITNDKK